MLGHTMLALIPSEYTKGPHLLEMAVCLRLGRTETRGKPSARSCRLRRLPIQSFLPEESSSLRRCLLVMTELNIKAEQALMSRSIGLLDLQQQPDKMWTRKRSLS